MHTPQPHCACAQPNASWLALLHRLQTMSDDEEERVLSELTRRNEAAILEAARGLGDGLSREKVQEMKPLLGLYLASDEKGGSWTGRN